MITEITTAQQAAEALATSRDWVDKCYILDSGLVPTDVARRYLNDRSPMVREAARTAIYGHPGYTRIWNGVYQQPPTK